MAQQSLSDVVDRILTMRKMEASYCFQQYLQTGGQDRKLQPLSAAWRTKVTQWAFNVVDHFGLSRETVAVSMGIFDRYLATLSNTCSGNMVLLTSLTTLHIAIKLHETKRIKSSILANLSRDQFQTDHIDEMELKIVSALGWKLQSPTPLAFLSEFLYFLPEEVTSAERREVYELSKYLTELAVCESSFVECQNSVIACASIRIVINHMNFVHLTPQAKDNFICSILEIMGQKSESRVMLATRERLWVLFSRLALAEPIETSYSPQASSARVVSPCSSFSSSMMGKSYDSIQDSHLESKLCDSSSETRSNFWYTPSPPGSTHSFGTIKVAPVRQ